VGFWSNLFGKPNHAGITANPNPLPSTVGESGYNPGDPDGLELVGFEPSPEARALPRILPSPWSGWPSSWDVPNWDFGSRFNELVDVAWACIDLNASVLSAMPVYQTRGGKVTESDTWMTNPDPSIYTSWHEFAKQLFWEFHLGEAFVLPMSFYSDGWPMRFRVIPQWLMRVEMDGGSRRYQLGGPGGVDVTNEILHIRYKSTTTDAHGVGPLEVAGGRMLTAGVLAKYAREIASTGGVPAYTLETNEALTAEDAQDLLEQWVVSRSQNLGAPPVLDNAVSLKTHMAMSPKDMALLEISQFNEARIAIMLGVPPFLVGLPSGGDSMTYSNVSSLFDFHDRASLRPKASHVMSALSNWALPRGQAAELNRDEYTRPAFNERAAAWVALKNAGLVSLQQFQAAERFLGEAPDVVLPDPELIEPVTALTGGDQS
jgi:HK97 family phage portal protein